MSKSPEELQADLEAALASIKKLEEKNKEILEENKKRKQEADEAREAAEAAAAEKERESKDVEAVEKRLKTAHDRELAKLKADIEARDAKLSTMLIDNAIAKSLTENNVAPQFAKAVTAMLKAEAKIENGEALMGDVPLSDGIKSYFASDEGKAFVSAPANAGGGAVGSNKTSTNQLPEQWGLSTYTRLKNDNPDIAKTYAEKFPEGRRMLETIRQMDAAKSN